MRAAAAAGLFAPAFGLLLLVVAPAFYAPLVDEGPGPAIVVALVLAGVAALDIALARAKAPTWLVVIAASVGLFVELFVVVLAPAVVLIMRNLAA